MIGPLGRLGAADTLRQHCPQMTPRPGIVLLTPKVRRQCQTIKYPCDCMVAGITVFARVHHYLLSGCDLSELFTIQGFRINVLTPYSLLCCVSVSVSCRMSCVGAPNFHDNCLVPPVAAPPSPSAARPVLGRPFVPSRPLGTMWK